MTLAGLLAVCGFADTANTFTYNGTPASTGYNEDVSASFIVSSGNLLVTLSNTTANLTYDKQILTGVLFTYAGAGSATGAVSNPTTTGYNIDDTNGALTSAGSVSANWKTETGDLTGYVTLTNLNNGNHAGSQGIVSTSTNSSGTNNLANHDVFLEGPLQFSISGLGLTSASQITGVEFNFGTAIGTETSVVAGALTPDPEPTPFVLLSAGLIAISWVDRKRFAKP